MFDRKRRRRGGVNLDVRDYDRPGISSLLRDIHEGYHPEEAFAPTDRVRNSAS
jgi:hypothetical protein